MTQAEWDEIFLLVENMNSGQDSQNIPSPGINLEFNKLQGYIWVYNPSYRIFQLTFEDTVFGTYI